MSDRLIDLKEVERLVGFKKSKIYALMDKDLFPQQVKVGACSRWSEAAVAAWIERLKQQHQAA